MAGTSRDGADPGAVIGVGQKGLITVIFGGDFTAMGNMAPVGGFHGVMIGLDTSISMSRNTDSD